MKGRNLKTIEDLMAYIYQTGTRLILVREDRSGCAEVKNALNLGGWSKEALQDVIEDYVKNRETP